MTWRQWIRHLREQPRFRSHETARMDELDSLPLARFWQRAIAFAVDFWLMLFLWNRCQQFWMLHVSHSWDGRTPLHFVFDREALRSIAGMVLYFSLCTWIGNGRTPGKWITRIRVVSLNHSRVTLWQAIERALGYGASLLEGGFGFAQYFLARNRQTVHDRIAETVVTDERRPVAAANVL